MIAENRDIDYYAHPWTDPSFNPNQRLNEEINDLVKDQDQFNIDLSDAYKNESAERMVQTHAQQIHSFRALHAVEREWLPDTELIGRGIDHNPVWKAIGECGSDESRIGDHELSVTFLTGGSLETESESYDVDVEGARHEVKAGKKGNKVRLNGQGRLRKLMPFDVDYREVMPKVQKVMTGLQCIGLYGKDIGFDSDVLDALSAEIRYGNAMDADNFRLTSKYSFEAIQRILGDTSWRRALLDEVSGSSGGYEEGIRDAFGEGGPIAEGETIFGMVKRFCHSAERAAWNGVDAFWHFKDSDGRTDVTQARSAEAFNITVKGACEGQLAALMGNCEPKFTSKSERRRHYELLEMYDHGERERIVKDEIGKGVGCSYGLKYRIKNDCVESGCVRLLLLGGVPLMRDSKLMEPAEFSASGAEKMFVRRVNEIRGGMHVPQKYNKRTAMDVVRDIAGVVVKGNVVTPKNPNVVDRLHGNSCVGLLDVPLEHVGKVGFNNIKKTRDMIQAAVEAFYSRFDLRVEMDKDRGIFAESRDADEKKTLPNGSKDEARTHCVNMNNVLENGEAEGAFTPSTRTEISRADIADALVSYGKYRLPKKFGSYTAFIHSDETESSGWHEIRQLREVLRERHGIDADISKIREGNNRGRDKVVGFKLNT